MLPIAPAQEAIVSGSHPAAAAAARASVAQPAEVTLLFPRLGERRAGEQARCDGQARFREAPQGAGQQLDLRELSALRPAAASRASARSRYPSSPLTRPRDGAPRPRRAGRLECPGWSGCERSRLRSRAS